LRTQQRGHFSRSNDIEAIPYDHFLLLLDARLSGSGEVTATVYTSLKRSVAATNSLAMPGSIPECPASGTTWKSASGKAFCSSHAVVTGHTTSYLRTRAPPLISQVHSSSIDHSKTLDAPALDDDGRDVADLERVVQQEALSREKSLVYEVVALDARECLGCLQLTMHLVLLVRLDTVTKSLSAIDHIELHTTNKRVAREPVG
jgi:hypothetical protein